MISIEQITTTEWILGGALSVFFLAGVLWLIISACKGKPDQIINSNFDALKQRYS